LTSQQRRILFAVITTALMLPPQAFAQASPVYRSTDKNGRVTYSSKPSLGGKSTQLELREIMKGGTIKKDDGNGCSQHGGVDCPGGADKDGSVICVDGYKDASTLYRYTCPVAHLELLSITQKDGAPSALVVIRNSRSVDAIAPTARIRSKTGPGIPLHGPTRVEGGGIGVFEVTVPKGVLPGGSQKLLRNHLWITCGNCG
jgi:hypothetical protein